MTDPMKKFVANPIEVDAAVIVEVHAHDANHMRVVLDNGESKLVNLAMTARMQPKIGDYYVIQEDGYVYLNPKDVFERKYSPKETEPGKEDGLPKIQQETQISDVPVKKEKESAAPTTAKKK